MRKGFTLLELLISLALIGTVLLGLQILLRTQLMISEHSWRYREAVDLAANALECRTYERYLYRPEKTGYVWSETIAYPVPGQLSVTVTVTWQDSTAQENSVALHRDYFRGIN